MTSDDRWFTDLRGRIGRLLRRPMRQSWLSASIAMRAGKLAAPPEAAKRRHLRRLLENSNIRVFVESGTYQGNTTAAMRPYVDRVITVELEPELAARGRRRFEHDPCIEVVEGDALEQIPRIASELVEPALVYLDGHYSGPGTGLGDVVEPAASIIDRLGGRLVDGSVVVVDDLRLMQGREGFPQLDELVLAARNAFPAARIGVGLDTLVIEIRTDTA